MADNDKVEAQEETPVGDETDSVEEENASEESEQSSDEESDEAKEKTSNWKAMSKALKAARKELAELKKAKESDEETPATSVEKGDLALFFVENPDAKDYKAAVLKAMKTYGGISLDQAWKFVQATAPKPSETKKDMSVKYTASNPPKDLTKLSAEEAVKLPNSQYLKWARANGRKI
jgi:hypothetical protein